MLRDITLGQYYPVDSVLHRMDPRTKLFGTLVYIVTLFIADSVWAYGLAAPVLGSRHPPVQGADEIYGARAEIHCDPASHQRQLQPVPDAGNTDL